jgi:hypothetical protein
VTDNLNKEEFAERLAEEIVESYDLDTLLAIVWDQTYEELLQMSWTDLRMTAEDYGVEL